MRTKLFLAVLVVGASPLAVRAADVEIKGAHLCCGACVKAVAGTLGKIEGISDAACDREAKTIKFKATDAKIARRAVRRLAFAGFFGKAAVDGKAVKALPTGAKKGEKSDKTVVRNVHLCCGACVKAASAAAKTVKGVEGVEADRKKRSLTVTGNQFDVDAVVVALRKVGLNGRVGVRKKKKKD